MYNKFIATTRFNNNTYEQNNMYKSRIGHTGCLYGTPIKIKEKIPLESHVYVIEMNNTEFKSIEELKLAYANGQREFEGWDFEEEGSDDWIKYSLAAYLSKINKFDNNCFFQ